MSFSSNAKDELVKIRLKGRLEKLCLLCALTNAAGSLTLGQGGRLGVSYVTESHSVGRLAASTAQRLYRGLEASISVREREGLHARCTVVRISGPDCVKLIKELGIISDGPQGAVFISSIPGHLITGELGRVFLRGAFLGAGSISDPVKVQGYHLELIARKAGYRDVLSDLIQGNGLAAKSVFRNGNHVVYIKDGEMISDFLTLIGAQGMTLDFENARVVKSFRNKLNRANNCESANMDKTARAAVSQIAAIRIIQNAVGLEHLPPALREMAEIRINYPEASLSDMSRIAGIGKSGVNHRLQKLLEMARQIEVCRKGDGYV